MPWMKRSPSLLELATAPAAAYTPRKPQETVVWQVTQQHWLDFRAEAHRRADGPRIAGFVDAAMTKFLSCGFHSGGFARLRCRDCHDDTLVPFSCKQRGVCSSCDGRRMAEQAAHLLDEVIPEVPV